MKRSDLIRSMPKRPMSEEAKGWLYAIALTALAVCYHTVTL